MEVGNGKVTDEAATTDEREKDVVIVMDKEGLELRHCQVCQVPNTLKQSGNEQTSLQE